jgi:hypothetical protein
VDDFVMEPAGGGDAWFAGVRQRRRRLHAIASLACCWRRRLLLAGWQRTLKTRCFSSGAQKGGGAQLAARPPACYRRRCTLLPSRCAPPALHPPTPAGAQWAKPSVPELRRAMRRLFDDRALAARLGVAAREGIIQKYDNEKVRGQLVLGWVGGWGLMGGLGAGGCLGPACRGASCRGPAAAGSGSCPRIWPTRAAALRGVPPLHPAAALTRPTPLPHLSPLSPGGRHHRGAAQAGAGPAGRQDRAPPGARRGHLARLRLPGGGILPAGAAAPRAAGARMAAGCVPPLLQQLLGALPWARRSVALCGGGWRRWHGVK